MSLSPSKVKHTDQESGGELCKIFKFWSFLQSKSVNNVCKLLQLLEDCCTDHYHGFAPRPHWGRKKVSQIPWAIDPQMKLPGVANVYYYTISLNSRQFYRRFWASMNQTVSGSVGAWPNTCECIRGAGGRVKLYVAREKCRHAAASTASTLVVR